MDINRQMREEWTRRAREDAFFYAGFGRKQQQTEEFLASAAPTISKMQGEIARIPERSPASRRALEIGCGPGRLMLGLSAQFGEIHGVDVSEEMVALARQNLKHIPHAHLHVTSGSDLVIFSDDFFDFVYSYIVFQHIPDRDVVWNYLRESRRVLKRGGVLCCQLRGAPPLTSEMRRESSTWTGSFFHAEKILEFSRANDFHLVLLEGIETQYLWTTWIKPAPVQPTDFSKFELKAVTAANGAENAVPARGRHSAVSLWIDGLPSSSQLGNLRVKFGDIATAGCYLSPISRTGACQLNARLPPGLPVGRYSVALAYDSAVLGRSCPLDVIPPPPRRPRVLEVSDGINIAAHRRVETGGVKVTLEDIENPAEVTFRIAGRPAEFLQYERKDPITDTYEFAFHLSDKTPRGSQRLEVLVSSEPFAAESIEVAGPGKPGALVRWWHKLLARGSER